MNTPAWQIRDSIARLVETGASIDLSKPSAGVTGLPGIDGAVLGVRPTATIVGEGAPAEELAFVDAYPRGEDLVAHYGPTASFPFRTEVYWRACADADPSRTRLSLIVSVETDLLDTQPELTVVSRLAERAVEPLTSVDGGLATSSAESASAVLLNSSADDSAWLEAVHPSDAVEATLEAEQESSGLAVIQWRLFSRFLEKGVIRRARLAACPLPEGELPEATAFYRGFASQPPPLTV